MEKIDAREACGEQSQIDEKFIHEPQVAHAKHRLGLDRRPMRREQMEAHFAHAHIDANRNDKPDKQRDQHRLQHPRTPGRQMRAQCKHEGRQHRPDERMQKRQDERRVWKGKRRETTPRRVE